MKGINADYVCDTCTRLPREWAEVLERVPFLQIQMMVAQLSRGEDVRIEVLTTDGDGEQDYSFMKWMLLDAFAVVEGTSMFAQRHDRPGWFMYGVRLPPKQDTDHKGE